MFNSFCSFTDARVSGEFEPPRNANITITCKASPTWRHDIIIKVGNTTRMFTRNDELQDGPMMFYHPRRGVALDLVASSESRTMTFTFVYHIPFPPGNDLQYPATDTVSPEAQLAPTIFDPSTKEFEWGRQISIWSENTQVDSENNCVININAIAVGELK